MQLWRAFCDGCGSAGPDGGVAVLLHSVPGLLERPHHDRLLHQPLSGHVLLHGGTAVSTDSISIKRTAQEKALYIGLECQQPCCGRSSSCSATHIASASDGFVGCIFIIAVLRLLSATYCMGYGFAWLGAGMVICPADTDARSSVRRSLQATCSMAMQVGVPAMHRLQHHSTIHSQRAR